MTTLYDEATPHPAGHRDVRIAQVHADGGKTRTIDVREPDEYEGELGHIAGAELVPLATVLTAAEQWDKRAPLVMICRSGGRSERAAVALTNAGFSRVMNMLGGMLAWNDAKLPIERASR